MVFHPKSINFKHKNLLPTFYIKNELLNTYNVGIITHLNYSPDLRRVIYSDDISDLNVANGWYRLESFQTSTILSKPIHLTKIMMQCKSGF